MREKGGGRRGNGDERRREGKGGNGEGGRGEERERWGEIEKEVHEVHGEGEGEKEGRRKGLKGEIQRAIPPLRAILEQVSTEMTRQIARGFCDSTGDASRRRRGGGGGLLTCCLDAGARAVKANCAPQAIAFFTLLDKFEGAADDHRFIFGFFFSF